MLKRVLALILLVMLFIPAAHAEEYVTVQELYQETRTPWQATYFFPNGEDYAALSANYSFSVDLIPSVPDVERFPILKLKTVPITGVDGNFSTRLEAEVSAKEQSLGHLCIHKGSFKSNMQNTSFGWRFYDEMGTARDNPLTPDDAAQVALNLWKQYLGVDNIQVRGVIGYDWEPKPYGEYQNMEASSRERLTLDCGVYTVVGSPVFAGIPLLESCHCEQDYGEYMIFYPYLYTAVTLQDEERFVLDGATLEVVEETISDVPLLPFSRIREVYEQALANDPFGRPLIHIVSAELGYKLILAPGETGDQLAENVYMTQPVWILRGYRPMQLFGSERDRQDENAQEQNYLAHVQARTLGLDGGAYLCINAQTGEVIEPLLKSSQTAEILTWDAQ